MRGKLYELPDWIKRSTEELNIVGTYNLIYNASIMVEENVGYALCIDKLINTSKNSKLCFRPLFPPQKVGIYIVWKKYQVFSKAADKFMETIKQTVK